jgi:hypothetical protein
MSVTRRGVLLAFVFDGAGLMRALDFSQARDRVAYTARELLYGLYAASRGRAQLFAQKQLRLAYDARQRIVYLVPHVGHKVCYLQQLRFLLRYERTQALFRSILRFVL